MGFCVNEPCLQNKNVFAEIDKVEEKQMIKRSYMQSIQNKPIRDQEAVEARSQSSILIVRFLFVHYFTV